MTSAYSTAPKHVAMSHQAIRNYKKKDENGMEIVNLNKTDIEVSRIGLGTWAISAGKWDGTEERTSVKTILSAISLRINLIDVAQVYVFCMPGEIASQTAMEYGKRVIHLVVRWMLDQPIASVTLWDARKPEQVEESDKVMGLSLDKEAKGTIDRMIKVEPVGPEFMDPPTMEKVVCVSL